MLSCLKCGSDTSVTYTSTIKSLTDGTSFHHTAKRRRKCRACSFRFTTYERFATSIEEVALTARTASLASIHNATQLLRDALTELEGDEPEPRNTFP